MSQQLQLKVLWLKNSLGLAIDQTFLDHSYSLTQYYFWPKTKAWEQLKLELDSKAWITENEKIKILNSTAEIMNYWRTSRKGETSKTILDSFTDIKFVKLNN